ncbi:FUSC family protein [Bordetella genomosp. 9]|uniref:Integral membrane bound transporter domain-containing protein n=1 Tax=Bordetella genomosp. 9 TaxID=1416803 RepID=A0A1W6YVX3_9BORD|nr:FUSC family protein [Bordetella genomosp. 9]ARP85255.1 hypothetical protein CAL13_02760 [Bordetella genomosp. 9]
MSISTTLSRLHDPLRRMALSLQHLASPYQRYRHAQGLHAIRVALAMLTTILITSGLDVPHGDWASVSMLVVIGGIQHHGNIRKKAVERGLGTMLGAAAGLLLIVVHDLFGAPAATYALLSLMAGICGYYAIGRGGYIALLTAITLIIVAGHGDNSIETGMWRTLNVFIGIVVALVFSFALPLLASFSWRYGMALNLRRAGALIDRLLSGETLTAEARDAAFADLTRRSISLRNLMPSVAKEMQVPLGMLEAIQTQHRSFLATLELISNVPLGSADGSHQAVLQAFRREGRTMRAMLLTMARALRAGNTRKLQSYAAGDLLPQSLPDAGAPPLPEALQGPYWLMRQAMGQVDRLRGLLMALRQRQV